MDRRDAATGEFATIPAVLAERARRDGTRVAVVSPEGQLTYAGLAAAARRVTQAVMARSVRPGERVAIWAPNTPRWVIAALGVLGAGATLVPLGTRLRGPEAAGILARSRCRMLLTVSDFLGNDYPGMLRASGSALPELRTVVFLDESRENRPEELSWARFLDLGEVIPVAEADARSASVAPESISDILFTSGTTGAPKGVPTTHRQTIEAFTHWADAVTLSGDDRYLLVNPFAHTFGYKAGIIACLLRGATMVPVDRFDPERVFGVIERERITVLTGPPTLFHDLLAHDRRADCDLSSLRLAGTGGSSVPTELVERIRRELGAGEVFTGYGLTESTGVATVCPPDTPMVLLAETVGKALPETQIHVVDDAGQPVPVGQPGEIVVRGPNVMHGYLDDPAATATAIDAGGWLHTGDIGTLDADGYLRITDRRTDMFMVGGFNVYPAEIERILRSHPAIGEAAVIGVPDARLGEVGHAFVVPDGIAEIDPAEIIAWARTHLAGYKLPRRLEIVAALPRNASGKVLKRVLRSHVAQP
ncbi:FadD3 family acyl-CoA ligase [Nocardia sp. CY41]|uniref:FadD3 family acyl-CoA ligase n=1 Tax=Nocardia sp. CY41 TaxID=2608686 RepID=UPI00135B37F1|nr:FadD3 family acyl-CoA ligase [Nocardia sp. CY41]